MFKNCAFYRSFNSDVSLHLQFRIMNTILENVVLIKKFC